MNVKKTAGILSRIVASALVAATPAFGAGEFAGRHVVVVVWDGMRPDFANESNAPILCELARHGVTFLRHHSTYISATEVNGTAITTGDYPSHSGLIGNAEYRPDIDLLKITHTEILESVRKGDEVAKGHYLHVPTLPELARHYGGKAVVAGAKPVALLPDRFPRDSDANGANLFAGQTLPEALQNAILSPYGKFPAEPPKGSPVLTRNDWTTKALIHPLWDTGIPDFTLLWLNQPDAAQHAYAPGAAESLAAIRDADRNLQRVLQALESKGVRDKTDIFVVSDHGCSTISSQAEVAETLAAAGFPAVREFRAAPKRGEILVASNGGSCLIYVIGHERSLIGKVVRFLQSWPNTGVIFTREPIPGAFRLSKVHLDSGNAPDILFSLHWTADKNTNGAPGQLIADKSSYGPGQGHHGSLSPFDMHNILVAAGPDIRSGESSEIPSGNTDIAPTVMWLLGRRHGIRMDGRVLSEALKSSGPALKSQRSFKLEASTDLGQVSWRQYLQCAQVNGVDYFDEGNGQVLKD